MLNKLMHTINLLGWLYASALAALNEEKVATVAQILLDHLNDGVWI